MSEDLPSLDIPGYISLKEAARLLGLSESRVYQYIQEERLSAAKLGRNIVLPLKEVQAFKPDIPGRKRKTPPSWRRLKVGGPLLTTTMHVQVREGQQKKLEKVLQEIEQEDRYTFPGTVARYVSKHATSPASVSIFLVWKKSEIPNGDAKAKALEEFQAKLADILDWSTAQYMEGEAIIHT
jgi:excisionase family DNA binding protein